ncbi:protein Sfk1p [Monosporozyma servazzii]
MDTEIRKSKKMPHNWWFIVPIMAFIPWYGMLISMLVCWAAQGKPMYWFQHGPRESPIYISDIGATNLRPLFISCAGWQGLGYFVTLISEYWQRSGGFTKKKHFYMAPGFTRHESRLLLASAIIGGLGQICLLMCSIFSTANYHHVHLSMVAVFVVLMFFSVCCHSTAYFIMGKYYALIHPLANLSDDEIDLNNVISNRQWKGYIWNKYTLSATIKMCWLTFAVVWAICFGGISNDSKSACFEWLLAFWFGILYVILAVDFYLGSRFNTESLYFRSIPRDHLLKFNNYKLLIENEDSFNDSFTTTSSKV